jgi:hypothetical protein
MDENSGQIIREIPMADLVEFFTDVGIKSKCIACEVGNTAINVYPSPDGSKKLVRLWMASSAEIMEDGSLRPSGHYYPTIYTICSNCGYVRNFSPSRVMSWMRERKKKVEGGE